MPHAEDFVLACMAQVGDAYVFGAEAKFSDANPSRFDCSELVEWAAERVGVAFVDGSRNQREACKRAGRLVGIDAAIAQRGALLFRMTGNPTHVAVSRGDGTTIEARGRAYGVNVFPARGRGWTDGGLIPGLEYAPSRVGRGAMIGFVVGADHYVVDAVGKRYIGTMAEVDACKRAGVVFVAATRAIVDGIPAVR